MESILNGIMMFLSKVPSYAPFLFLLLIIFFIAAKAHKEDSNNFSMYHLLSDKETGKGSLEKVGMFTGMLVVSWWFIDLAAQGKATWEDAIAYGGLLGLSKFANSWISARYKGEIK